MHGDTPFTPFAGDALLSLVQQGRLVLDWRSADEAVAGLECTLAEVQARLRAIRAWRVHRRRRPDLPDDEAQCPVDALFFEQLAPGRLEWAARELPKYIQALRNAAAP